MTDRDDYLWERRGEADPVIERLEKLLTPLAHDGRELPLDALPAQRRAPAPARHRWPWLLAAAAMLCVAVTAWLLYDPEPAEPKLAEGDAPRTFTTGKTPRTIELGSLATLTLLPSSELRFEHWRKDQALFTLQSGGLEAHVDPNVVARFFQIDTALGRVIDQGCRYVLSLDADGNAHVRVTEGAVTFEFPQRTVFVPAQAFTTVAKGSGPSTPLFLDCTPELGKMVRYYDDLVAKRQSTKGGAAELQKEIAGILEYCREPRDTLPLWHMLFDPDESVRSMAEDKLEQLVGPPPSTTKDDHWPAEEWLAFLRLRAW